MYRSRKVSRKKKKRFAYRRVDTRGRTSGTVSHTATNKLKRYESETKARGVARKVERNYLG